MPYRLRIPIPAEQAGLTWSAQLVDASNANVGSAITDGFSASGNNYIWDYDQMPDSFTEGKIVFTANTGLLFESQIIPGATFASSSDHPAGYFFDDLAEADEMAATIAGLATYKAAADDDARAAALESAANRIDAKRWQGRRYDLATPQPREFPRVARSGSGLGPLGVGLPFVPDLASINSMGLELWDYDTALNVAVIPKRVKLANLYEADCILDGSRDKALNAAGAGIASQSIGSASKSYFKPDVIAGANPMESLCRDAELQLKPYRLRIGEAL